MKGRGNGEEAKRYLYVDVIQLVIKCKKKSKERDPPGFSLLKILGMEMLLY